MAKIKMVISGVVLASTLMAACDSNGSSGAQAAPAAAMATAQMATRPRAVQAAIDEETRACRAAGGRFIAEDGFDTRLALNGDEAPDHVLNYNATECQGAGDDYSGAARGGREGGCGRNGCPVEVFMSGPGGHQSVLRGSVWEVQFVRDAQPARLRISASNMPGCDASYAEGCHAEWGWNGSAFVQLRRLRREDVVVSDGHNAAEELVEEADSDPGQTAASEALAAPGGLPFREGSYRPYPDDPEFTGSWAITGSEIRYSDSAVAFACQIQSQIPRGSSVRLTLRCEVPDRASVQYERPYTLTIHAESSTLIRVEGAHDLAVLTNGRYRRQGPAW